MTEGNCSVQDETGMWHQILDDSTTYEEASSTSMFICAFSRGIRLGIIKDNSAKPEHCFHIKSMDWYEKNSN